METKVTKETLVRYLDTSSLTEEQKKDLLVEFEKSNGSAQVFNKAITLNGRRAQTKVSGIPNIK